MDSRYRDIYASIYVGRTGSLPGSIFGQTPLDTQTSRGRWPIQSAPLGEVIRDAIESAEQKHGRVREDGKALLAVNFQDLIVEPLAVGGSGALAELPAAMTADIETLVATAAKIAEPDPDGISAHAIVDSLSQNWSNLQVSRFRLWERSGE